MTWNNPAGGYFFWLELADDVDGKAVQLAAFVEGVLCRPGERFYGEPEHGEQRFGSRSRWHPSTTSSAQSRSSGPPPLRTGAELDLHRDVVEPFGSRATPAAA